MDTQIELRPDRIEYKITITKITRHDYIGNDRKLLEKRHYTDKEMEEQHRYMDREEDKAKFVKEIYGTVNSLEVDESKIEIYSQSIVDLNLPTVIKAINGL